MKRVIHDLAKGEVREEIIPKAEWDMITKKAAIAENKRKKDRAAAIDAYLDPNWVRDHEIEERLCVLEGVVPPTYEEYIADKRTKMKVEEDVL